MIQFCSFLWPSNIPLCVWIFLIHSSVDGHLCCFHVLANANSRDEHWGASAILIHVFLWYMSSSGIAGSYGSSIFSFLRTLHTVGVHQFTFLPTVQEGSVFSTPSSAFKVCKFFDDGHSEWCKDIHLGDLFLNLKIFIFIKNISFYCGQQASLFLSCITKF